MLKGFLNYLLLLSLMIVLWVIALGYFPFLLCLVFVFIFFMSYLISYKAMKSTTVNVSLLETIIERRDQLSLNFKRINHSLLPCGKVVVEYKIYNVFHKCIRHHKIVLEDQEFQELISIKHSGYYTIEINHIYCYDILQCLYKKQDDYKILQFYVFPSLLFSSLILEESTGKNDESYEYSPYRQGEDFSEIFDLREYREGDALKHIHWKATLKHNEILVKDGSQPLVKKILLAVMMNKPSRENDVALDRFFTLCSSMSQKQIAYEILCPQVDSHFYNNEVITNDDCYRECLKRILKTPTNLIYETFQNRQDITSLYVIKTNEIEVLEK